MAKKIVKKAGGGSLADKAKKYGADAGKMTSFGKFLTNKINEADATTSRMKTLREKGPEALADEDRGISKFSEAAKAAKDSVTDSMGTYKKGGAVKRRGDGIAQRGRTKGRFI